MYQDARPEVIPLWPFDGEGLVEGVWVRARLRHLVCLLPVWRRLARIVLCLLLALRLRVAHPRPGAVSVGFAGGLVIVGGGLAIGMRHGDGLDGDTRWRRCLFRDAAFRVARTYLPIGKGGKSESDDLYEIENKLNKSGCPRGRWACPPGKAKQGRKHENSWRVYVTIGPRPLGPIIRCVPDCLGRAAALATWKRIMTITNQVVP